MANDCFTEAALNFQNAEITNAPILEPVQVTNTVAETPKTETPTTTNQPTKKETKPSKMHDYREHLKTITNGLVELAKEAKRTDYTSNTLLRECYNLIGATLDTFDGWKEKGFSIKKGEHAYLFWGKPITSETGIAYCPVNFLFAQEQVRQNQAS